MFFYNLVTIYILFFLMGAGATQQGEFRFDAVPPYILSARLMRVPATQSSDSASPDTTIASETRRPSSQFPSRGSPRSLEGLPPLFATAGRGTPGLDFFLKSSNLLGVGITVSENASSSRTTPQSSPEGLTLAVGKAEILPQVEDQRISTPCCSPNPDLLGDATPSKGRVLSGDSEPRKTSPINIDDSSSNGSLGGVSSSYPSPAPGFRQSSFATTGCVSAKLKKLPSAES